jgi:hypothetical protein
VGGSACAWHLLAATLDDVDVMANSSRGPATTHTPVLAFGAGLSSR